MAKINNAELKRIIAALKNGKFESPLGRSGFTRPPVTRNHRRSIAKLVESAAMKAGLDVSKVDKLLAKDQNALRADFDKQKAWAARNSRSAEAAFRRGTAARLQALELLSTPFTSSVIKIVRPFLIWQQPMIEADVSFDPHIEYLNSSIKFLVNTIGGTDYTQFVFYFLWRNESESPVVVDVDSSLFLNGNCSVSAAPGFLSGDVAYLNMNAGLGLIQWIGWGTDPHTGASNDQTFDPNPQPTQFQTVTDLKASGGHIFDGADFHSQLFSLQPFPLSRDMFMVPGNASVIFQVGLTVQYSFAGGPLEGGGNLGDNVTVDFSTNGNAVVCPLVELDIMTPTI